MQSRLSTIVQPTWQPGEPDYQAEPNEVVFPAQDIAHLHGFDLKAGWRVFRVASFTPDGDVTEKVVVASGSYLNAAGKRGHKRYDMSAEAFDALQQGKGYIPEPVTVSGEETTVQVPLARAVSRYLDASDRTFGHIHDRLHLVDRALQVACVQQQRAVGGVIDDLSTRQLKDQLDFLLDLLKSVSLPLRSSRANARRLASSLSTENIAGEVRRRAEILDKSLHNLQTCLYYEAVGTKDATKQIQQPAYMNNDVAQLRTVQEALRIMQTLATSRNQLLERVMADQRSLITLCRKLTLREGEFQKQGLKELARRI